MEKPDIEIESTKLEKWNTFVHENFGLPDRIRLVDIETKDNHYLKYILIAVGLIAIALVILYLGYDNKFKSDISCNETLISNLTCGDNICPVNSCPACSCNLNCGNTTINPVVYTNSS